MSSSFVVGNGPSLKHTDLNKIKGISFACNNIHLIYPYTKWRPTHYVRAEEFDTNIKNNDWQESIDIHKELGCEMWCNHMFKAGGNEIVPCTHYRKHFNNPDCPHLWHFPVLCGFGSSVNVAIQIAVKMGYDPIYLVGCDLSIPYHFDTEYKHAGMDPFWANNDTLAAHMVAARSSHARIYNATIGGNLECYERIDFNDICK